MTQFRRERELGHGFFGRVYLEYDTGLGKYCAAKYLENTGLLITENAEAQAMQLGLADNVVEVYSTDTVDGTPVIRMEYLRNGSVADRYGSVAAPVIEALRIMEAACRGIEHIHTVGLLHRDIKPANILLDDEHIAKVSDFGLACRIGEIENTPIPYAAHLPPEALEGGSITDRLGDVFGLGVTTYRLLNGDRRIRGKLDNLPLNIPNSHDWQPYIHKTLRRAVSKAIHSDPTKRTQSASDFRHDLEKSRPAVSWSPSINDPKTWTGTQLDGTNWQATIQERPGRDTYEFRIRRQLPGKEFRVLSREDNQRFASYDSALAHAAKILQRVATQGR